MTLSKFPDTKIVPIASGEFYLPNGATVSENICDIFGRPTLFFQGQHYKVFEVLPNGRMVSLDSQGNLTTVRNEDVNTTSPNGTAETTRMLQQRTQERTAQVIAQDKELSDQGLQIGDFGPNGGLIVKANRFLIELR